MILGFTCNIGNYESIKFQTNELDTIEECRAEIKESIEKLKHIHLIRFWNDNFADSEEDKI